MEFFLYICKEDCSGEGCKELIGSVEELIADATSRATIIAGGTDQDDLILEL